LRKKKRKEEEEEEVVNHSFFSFKLKPVFISLHHWLSLAARQPLVSSGNIH
jgi:hypothetical protein